MGNESAGSAGEGEHATGVSTKVNLDISQCHPGGCTVGVVDQTRGNLGTETELVGGCGGGWKDAQIPFSADGVYDGIHRRSDLAEDRMAVRDVVKTVADAADFPAASEAAERHGNGTGIAEIVKVVWGKRPSATLRLDPAEDLLGLIWCRGDVHVVNDAWFLQRSKHRFFAGKMVFLGVRDLVGEWVGDLVGG